MRRRTRLSVAVAAAAAVAVALGTGSARAAGPTREVFQGGSDFVTTLCGFPVHWQSSGRAAVITFVDGVGNVVKTIEPAAGVFRVTLTNLDTQKSLTYNVSGPGIFEAFDDGSFSFTTFGPWLVIRNPLTLEFGIFVIKGQRERFQDAAGNVTFTFHGEITDVCAALAADG